MNSPKYLVLVSLALVIVFPHDLPADTLIDDFQVNTEFPGHPPQDSPLSVANWGTQTIYTTWLSQRDGTNWDVALIRHNYDLEPIGEATYLNVREGTYNCLKPRLVISSAGVGAAWIEARSPNRIMFRSLDAAGNPLSPPVRVENDFQNFPRDSLNIAALTDGYLLVWYDLRDSSKIWAQKVDFSGSLIGANFPIQPDSTGSILGLEAQNHPDGRVVVSWVANGQYSRGRWLDAQGNFMGGVFDMAEAMPPGYISNSLVRFESEGNGILYQYGPDSPPYFDWSEMWLIHLNFLAQPVTDTLNLGCWRYFYGSMWQELYYRSFPDIILLPAFQKIMVFYEYDYFRPMGQNAMISEHNTLISEPADTLSVPWGITWEHHLCELDSQHFLYTFNLQYAGLRTYQISTLDSSESLTWIVEPGWLSAQTRPQMCAFDDGDFRIAYLNHLSPGKQVYTRHFNQEGISAAPDTLVSIGTNLYPTISNNLCLNKTGSTAAIVVYDTPYQILGSSFAGAAWNNNVHEYFAELWSWYSLVGAVRCDVNASDHLILVWAAFWNDETSGYGRQEYIRPYAELFNPLHEAVGIGSINADFFPPDRWDVALRNDGRFLVCLRQSASFDRELIWFLAGQGYYIFIVDSTALLPEVSFDSCSAPVAGNGVDGYWIAWAGKPNGQPTGVYLAHVDSLGQVIGVPETISSMEAQPISDPDLAVSDSSDNFAVVWQDARNDSGDIYCRQFNPDGSFFGREYRVNSDPVGVLQKEPAVALGPNDQLYFTWTDFRNPGGQGDIYCKVIEWQDALYAQEEPVQIPRRFALYPPSPNPFNSATVIRFELPQASWISLQVFDISGRMVGADLRIRPGGGRTPALQEEWMDAGKHEVRFDGSGLASGIYIVRLQAGDFSAAQKLILLK